MEILIDTLAVIATLIGGSFLVSRYAPELEIAIDWWADLCRKGRRQ
jgi:hypothetical protein